MNETPPDILHCIGNTSLVPLRNIVPVNGSRVFLKLEIQNLAGSMRLSEKLGPGATIVTLMCDTGMKYPKTYGAELARRAAAVSAKPA